METTSAEIGEVAKALAAAQGAMKNAPLNKTNPHFKSKYADLVAIRDTVLPVLAKHGLSVVQYTSFDASGGLSLRTRLMHESGQWIEGSYPLPNHPEKPQAMGSATTYARRYCLAAIVGIAAEEDDDANAAQEAGGSQPARRAQASRGQARPAAPKPAVSLPAEPGAIPVPRPESDDQMPACWQAWAEAFSNAIQGAESVEVFDAWMEANRPALKNLEGFSDTGKKWAYALYDRADKRRGMLAQAPLVKEKAA